MVSEAVSEGVGRGGGAGRVAMQAVGGEALLQATWRMAEQGTRYRYLVCCSQWCWQSVRRSAANDVANGCLLLQAALRGDAFRYEGEVVGEVEVKVEIDVDVDVDVDGSRAQRIGCGG